MRGVKKELIIILCAVFLLLSTNGFALKGRVFFDLNLNGVFDPGELGAEGFLVSDGKDIVITDENGCFCLDTDQPFVFIILPDEYTCTTGWYKSVSNEEKIEFGLSKVSSNNNIFVVISDLHYAENPQVFSQALRDRSMKYDVDHIMKKLVEELKNLKPSFVMCLGDIGASIRDTEEELAIAQLRRVKQYLDEIGSDVFYAVGNHEVNSKTDKPTKVYEEVLGPRYYSFNRCGIHFIVLDVHLVKEGKLQYSIDDIQLKWLQENLGFVPDDRPIVVFSHEPVCDWADTINNITLKNLLIDYGITAHISGHWHMMIALSDYPYLELTSGAVSGAWWEGPSASGDEFGYTVFEIRRGSLSYAYFNIGEKPSIWIQFPLSGVLSGIVPIRVVASDCMRNPAIYVDGMRAEVEPLVVRRTSWTEYLYRLNVTNLNPGRHELLFEANTTSGKRVSKSKSFWVDNRTITFKQLKDFSECFLGRIVTIADTTLAIKYGSTPVFEDKTDRFMVKIANPKILQKLSSSESYNLTGIFKDPGVVPDPLRIYPDEGIIRK